LAFRDVLVHDVPVKLIFALADLLNASARPYSSLRSPAYYVLDRKHPAKLIIALAGVLDRSTLLRFSSRSVACPTTSIR
jgi:hypothetical protein